MCYTKGEVMLVNIFSLALGSYLIFGGSICIVALSYIPACELTVIFLSNELGFKAQIHIGLLVLSSCPFKIMLRLVYYTILAASTLSPSCSVLCCTSYMWYLLLMPYSMTTYSFRINQAVGPLKMWARIEYNVILPQFDR